jgi:hypothetical protein
LFTESPEDLEGTDDEKMGPIVILACLSQSDETAFNRLRNGKRGNIRFLLQIMVVSFPIDFYPAIPVHRAWLIDDVYNVLIDFVDSIIGNLASTRIRALSTAGAGWILGGDIFMTLTLVITGKNLAFLILHCLIAIFSFVIFTFTILLVIDGYLILVPVIVICLSLGIPCCSACCLRRPKMLLVTTWFLSLLALVHVIR